MKKYNRHNFHKHTFCIFKEIDAAVLQDLQPDYISKSGSMYHFTESGVYRISNHWGRAANCKWRLQALDFHLKNRCRAGYAGWEEFQSDNDIEKIYYIEIDWNLEMVRYNHKNNCKKENVVLRTASETTKRIKQIRELLKTRYNSADSEFGPTRKEIVEQLINTEKSIRDIKKDFHQ